MNHDYYRGAPLKIGQTTQLLLNDTLVEDRWRLRREICPPQKYTHNPVITHDKPWEGAWMSYLCAMRDEEYGKYRMWYTCGAPPDHANPTRPRAWLCHAESDDGFNWEKPLLDLYPYEEFGRTNIVYRGSYPEDPARYGAVGSDVFKDNDEPDPKRRYKMISYEARPDENGAYRRGVSLAVSPDGFQWSLNEDKPVLDYQSDAMNHVVHDPERARWLLYCRVKCTHASGLSPQTPVPGVFPQGRHMSRRVAVTTSRDFKNWSYPRICFYPDEIDASDYDAGSVFKWGNHFIMIYAAMEGDTTGEKEGRIAWSNDGFHWERPHQRAPFLPRGRQGDWDAGSAQRYAVPPVQQGENLLFYYSGAPCGQNSFHGRGGIGVATTQRDRFIKQAAGNEPGYLITREFILEGNRLQVNTGFDKNPYLERYIKAEIIRHPELGNHGKLMDPKRGRFGRFNAAHEGFGLADSDGKAVNGTEVLMTWKGNPDLSPLQGKPVYLRFELRNMGIFSFRISRE